MEKEKNDGGIHYKEESTYKITSSLSAAYIDGKCVLDLKHKINIKDKTTDYILKCFVSDKNMDIITSRFASVKDDDNQHTIGKSIPKSLIKHNLCEKMNNE